ncbi:bromo adjacent like protein [Purpureocillium lavendulum]|uniref:Bromo adjacent like protein n=1 Tax=Purpureocillium lavendulum TaxID=1247861 RepID=A0AB34FWV3_9HYPO|nr:bromo adjacent like protein [Purpureocillium lavendulum]
MASPSASWRKPSWNQPEQIRSSRYKAKLPRRQVSVHHKQQFHQAINHITIFPEPPPPTVNMKFTNITALALAAMVHAAPAETQSANQVDISLPPGCKKSDLIKCALHLVGTTASCGAAVIEVGANVAADLSCIGSAASTANNFHECKSCIPHKQNVIEV